MLGIDGMPFDLFMDKVENGEMPECREILKQTAGKAIHSVMPVVSSVAWTSYATGEYPIRHGIFGFTERDAASGELYLPTSKDRKRETIWQELSQRGKRVAVINVPLTYPPEQVNGIMVSCFLSPDLKRAVYPPELYTKLEAKSYIIDAKAPRSMEDKRRFLEDLPVIMKKRAELSMELMEEASWDYFHLHIMETDRLFHFFWDSVIKEDQYAEEIALFFQKLDYYIGALYKSLPSGTGFTMLSDHGFCGIVHEVQLNAWLKKEGYYHPSDLCALTPGRILIRAPESVNRELKKELRDKLLKLTDSSNRKVIKEVYTDSGQGADLLVHPADGYDLKSDRKENAIFTNSLLNGMHTFENAMLVSTMDLSGITDLTGIAKKIKEELYSDDL